MARKYNKKFYGIFKKGTKIVREYCSPDPMQGIKDTGTTGKMIGDIGDQLIEKPIHHASLALTSLSYDKKKDHPCKGSATYTAWNMGIKGILKIVGCALLGSVALASVVRFLNADFLTQMKMSSGTLIIIPIIWLVNKIKGFFKGKK